VNSVHPGFIATDMVTGAAGTLEDPEGFLQEITRRHPIGKLPEAIDVAYAVLYLASDESRHVVGAEMVVDGGYIAQ
jgi:NAD(P)-dependent dehydrogenase (short-subunit alcohol dehydrogenase family)